MLRYMSEAFVVSKTLEECNVCLSRNSFIIVFFVFFFIFFSLSFTPVVLLNYHSIIILEDSVCINPSKTSDDLASILRHKSYT